MHCRLLGVMFNESSQGLASLALKVDIPDAKTLNALTVRNRPSNDLSRTPYGNIQARQLEGKLKSGTQRQRSKPSEEGAGFRDI